MSADREALFRPIASAEVAIRAARGGALLAGVQLGRGLIEAAAMLVLARALMPSDFGVVDMVVSVTGIIDMLKDFGLSSATVQKQKIEHAQVSLLFWTNCAIGVVLTLLTAALAPLLAFMYGRPELLEITLTLSLTTLLGAVSVQHLAILRRNLRFEALAGVDFISAVSSNALAVWAALAGYGAWALVMRQLSKFALQAVLALVFCRWRPSAPGRANIGELLRFGSHVSGFQVINYIERNLDNVLIGRFAGAEQLGFYTKAYSLMRIPLDQLNALSAIAVPALSRLTGEPELYRNAYRTVTRPLLLITVPFAPLTIYGAEWLIPTILGDQWLGSVRIFQWLALGLVVKPLLNTTGWLWISQGRTEELWGWGKIGGVIAVLAFLIGLPWGALGVAAASVASDIFVRAPAALHWIGRGGPVRVRHMLGAVAPAWICAGAIAGVYPLIEMLVPDWSGGARFALCGGVSVTVSLALVAMTPAGKSTLQDCLEFGRLLRRKPGAAPAAREPQAQ